MLTVEGKVKMWMLQGYVAEAAPAEDRNVVSSSICNALCYPKLHFY